jgi:hypothetical protein
VVKTSAGALQSVRPFDCAALAAFGTSADSLTRVRRLVLVESAADFMMNSAATTLFTPANVSHRSSNDTYQYTGPVQIIHNGKEYHTYTITVSFANKSWNIITCYPN